MIRVAVIENESELQRYGYANVVEKLRDALKESKDNYLFYSFTSANIHRLFSDTEDGLMSFDGLFISTNSFSDLDVLNVIRKEKKQILAFVESGKGIYVGYQKKLNIETKYYYPGQEENLKKAIEKNTIDFLPDGYQYHMPEAYVETEEVVEQADGSRKTQRKLKAKDSKQGEIETSKNYDDILFKYPAKIRLNDIRECCKKNDFNEHIFKSYLQFNKIGSYNMLLQSTPTSNGLDFYPLLARAIPQNNERIVVSTVILDWENHKDLLRNIVVYITRGNPTIAFVQNGEESNKEFEFLVNSTKMSKLGCHVYEYSKFTADKKSLHNIFCFSPSITREQVKDIWDTVKNERRSIKIYHLSEDSTSKELVMMHYSNNGLLESIVNKSRLWFKKEYERIGSGLWGGFWNTYDILLMMRRIGENTNQYRERIRNAIRPRQNTINKSYDNVFGCTLGMIAIFLLFYEDNEQDLQDITDVILPWIYSNLNNKSVYEKLSYWLTFKDLSTITPAPVECSQKIINDVLSSEAFAEIQDFLRNTVTSVPVNLLSEIELCRWIKFLQLSGMGDEQPELRKQFTDALWEQRDIDGKWVNVSRTGYVLISLLTAFSKEALIDLKINDEIETSVNFLIDSYNENEGAWAEGSMSKDIGSMSSSATARAIHAIGLFNSMFPFTTKDFINVLKNDVTVANSSAVIDSALTSLTKVSADYSEQQKRVSQLQVELADEQAKLQQAQEQIQKDAEASKKNLAKAKRKHKKFRNTIILVITALAVIVIEQFVIMVRSDLIKDFWAWLFTLITTVVSFGVSLLLKGIIEKRLYPSDSSEEEAEREEMKAKRKNEKKGRRKKT